MIRVRSVCAILLGTWLIAGGLGTTRAAEGTAAELAQSLQKKIESVKDFSTDFVHAYQGGVLKKQVTERGHLLVKKPGKMRWDYTAPEAKQFVSDGVKLYSYVPQDKQVIVGTISRDNDATTPALFLAGKGSLTRDFTPSLVDLPAGLPTGSRALKLVPKSRERDYDWLILAVDPTTLAIRGLVTSDTQGGTSTFSFTNLKENVGVPDSEFVFKIPRGVDVINDSPSS
jgi:outer membrane lipoprotein carrier protein